MDESYDILEWMADLNTDNQYNAKAYRYIHGNIGIEQIHGNDTKDKVVLTITQIRNLNEFANKVEALTAKEVNYIIENSKAY